jgi:hypothetical protein
MLLPYKALLEIYKKNLDRKFPPNLNLHDQGCLAAKKEDK